MISDLERQMKILEAEGFSNYVIQRVAVSARVLEGFEDDASRYLECPGRPSSAPQAVRCRYYASVHASSRSLNTSQRLSKALLSIC